VTAGVALDDTAAKHPVAHDVGADALADIVDDVGVGLALAALPAVLAAPALGGERQPWRRMPPSPSGCLRL
jgi:hypothetical protein